MRTWSEVRFAPLPYQRTRDHLRAQDHLLAGHDQRAHDDLRPEDHVLAEGLRPANHLRPALWHSSCVRLPVDHVRPHDDLCPGINLLQPGRG